MRETSSRNLRATGDKRLPKYTEPKRPRKPRRRAHQRPAGAGEGRQK